MECWVAGKGPSVMEYDWSKAGEVYGINHAGLVIPRCKEVFALDSWCIPLLADQGLIVYTVEETIYNSDMGVPHGFSHPNVIVLDVPPEFKAGASVLALGLLYSWGMRRYHMIGFDSRNGDHSFPREILDTGTVPGPSGYSGINFNLDKLIETFEDTHITWGN